MADSKPKEIKKSADHVVVGSSWKRPTNKEVYTVERKDITDNATFIHTDKGIYGSQLFLREFKEMK